MTTSRVSLIAGLGFLLASCAGPTGPGECPDGCLTPPAPLCDGATLVSFAFLGECVDGACSYPIASQQTCTDGCADAACVVVPDACEGVVCDAPPEPACEDELAVTFAAAGTCDPATGACTYAEVRTDCVPRGQVCDAGRCVTPGLCDGVDCSDAPAPLCRGTTRVEFGAPGACDTATGECAWNETTTNCRASGQICRDGGCIDLPPCDGLDCSAVPVARCDGSVAVVASNGRCDASGDVCAWDEVRTDCFDDALACEDGACVPSDRCDDVTCGTAPPPECDGELAVSFFGAGRCDATSGTCRFERAATDCAAVGLACRDGACVDALCADVTCVVPPRATCEGDTAVAWEVPGACARGRCSYDSVRTDCTLTDEVCRDGACVEPPLCRGVLCESPPEPACEGDELVTHAAPGTCDETDGSCVYPPTRTDCAETGQTCRDGRCADRCEGIECLETPPPYCLGDLLRAPVGSGLCVDGACRFSEVELDCAATGLRCADGGCRDRCWGVDCSEPPPPTCVGTSAVTFAAPGACSASSGTCSFAPLADNCATRGLVCIAGACVEDPCLSMTCGSPPEPYCEGDVLRTPFGEGLCTLGDCDYAERSTNCANRGERCLDGACRDRCYGVACEIPPPSYCDGEVRVSYDATGVCDGPTGSCSYGATLTNCADDGLTCRDGACVVPPCRGVSCDAAPEPVCVGTVRVEAVAPGVCDEGLCEFAEARLDCATVGQRCDAGRCVGPCEGVVCDAPPAPLCSGSVLVTYADAGTCDERNGACSYAPSATSCAASGLVCRDGACAPPRCTGVVCDAPPEPYCAGSVLLTPFGAGTCVEETGDCDYALLPQDCAANGGRCGEGRCIAPCEDIVCDEPPADVCQGDVAVRFASAGVCDEVTVACDYASTRQNCPADGLVCRAGACVEPPCTGVSCDVPPAPYCAGDVLREPFGVGACNPLDGVCSFSERSVDCRFDNGRCQDGRCVGPCEGVVCDELPASFCAGLIAFSFTGDGDCIEPDGVCRYTPAVTNCSLSGEVCRAGACVEPPCTGVVCDDPPAPRCDGSVAVAAFGAGSCEPETGACVYAEAREECAVDGGRCEGGRCLGPCDGVACDSPPAPVCVGDVAVARAPTGTCSPVDGACSYEPQATNCATVGQVCREGACVEPPCAGVSCETPAAPVCDGTFLVSEFGLGVCDNFTGLCDYGELRVDCSQSGGDCLDGRCRDVCEVLTCDDLPGAACAGSVALTYPAGFCNRFTRACEYEPTRTDCAALGLECRDGACETPRCQGVVCDTPRAPYCDGETRVAELGDGACRPETGLCEFAANTRDCSVGGGICRDGDCLAPCDFLVCDDVPADVCVGDVVFDYTAGSCDAIAGECEYEPAFDNCATRGQVCVDGACVEPRCTGVVCDDPPASYCEGAALVGYRTPGLCDDRVGDCDYLEDRFDCGAINRLCVDGACVDRCFGVTCASPPDDTCVGSAAYDYDASRGSCSPETGACSYEPVVTRCDEAGELCRAGACVPDPCAGVECSEPPPGTCDGTRGTRSLAATGQCNPDSGSCRWDTATLDCAPLGLQCVRGDCVSLCDGVVCDDPPPAACLGDLRLTYPGTSACDAADGACIYELAIDNCALLGETCRFGECVPVDPCEGVECDTPVPPFCDDDRVITQAELGVCDEGICVHAETVEPCDGATPFCFDGVCVAADPCAEVACDEPPAAGCFGNRRFTYATPGVCNEAVCSYASEEFDCAAVGQVCQAGACVVPDPCDGEVCDTPPPSFCADGRAYVFADVGMCEGGTCRYDAAVDDCVGRDLLCVDAECVPTDPCAGVLCESGPEPFCVGDLRIASGELGQCIDGGCNYSVVGENCQAYDGSVCEDGECVPGPCTAVVCYTPENVCVTDTVMRNGVVSRCVEGDCVPEFELVDCAALDPLARCYDGVCLQQDPCEGVTCNAPYQVPECDGNTAVTYGAPGVCRAAYDGRCFYPERREDCSTSGGFCLDGACVSVDPCSGVVCDDPPSDGCAGNFAIRYVSAGTCLLGSCAYERVQEDCTPAGLFCLGGVCQDEQVCDELECFTPGTSFCRGTRRVDLLRGSCSGAECVRSEDVTECAPLGTCEDGRCVGDPCAGVTCRYPPPAYCDGSVSVTSSDGECVAGACAWLETRTDCAPLGLVCGGATCVRSVDLLALGEVVITELAADPSGAWIEMFNAAGREVDLNGLSVRAERSARTFVIDAALVVPADGFVVVGASPTAGGGADYVWPAGFAWDADDLLRVRSGQILDEVDLRDHIEASPARSTQLSVDAFDAVANDDPSAWCLATSEYISGRFGTPGGANEVCPP